VLAAYLKGGDTMRPDERKSQPVVVIPEDLIQLESDFQRIMYVEERIAQLSTLKHDRLMLRERFLQALTPPEVQLGFSNRINKLIRENQVLSDRLLVLTSLVDQLKREQITVAAELNKANDMSHRECENIDSIIQSSWSISNRWLFALVASFLSSYMWGLMGFRAPLRPWIRTL